MTSADAGTSGAVALDEELFSSLALVIFAPIAISHFYKLFMPLDFTPQHPGVATNRPS
jgi:hypothetical protein